jgi:hypothetical protein
LQERISISPARARLLYVTGWLLVGIGAASILNWMLLIDQLHPDFSQDYYAASKLSNNLPIYETQSVNNHPPFDAVLFIRITFPTAKHCSFGHCSQWYSI